MICLPNHSVQELKTTDYVMLTTVQIQFYRITGLTPKAISGLIRFSSCKLYFRLKQYLTFRISVGELLDNRYKSYAFTGKGVFSNVIRCKDKHEKDKDVAIKIIRKNDLMLKAGMKYPPNNLGQISILVPDIKYFNIF